MERAEPMAKTRRLTNGERESAKEILETVRGLVTEAAKGDSELAWALRRYVYVRLSHDERGNPMQRKLLKLKKWVSQGGKCATCGTQLPERGAELDRIETMKGYTAENARLVCHNCHRSGQEDRGFH
jgi:ribosomal protein L44E